MFGHESEGFNTPPPQADELPAADILLQPDSQFSNYSYEIKTPRQYIFENEIKVRETVVRKVRSRLKRLESKKRDWSDLLVGLFTLTASPEPSGRAGFRG